MLSFLLSLLGVGKAGGEYPKPTGFKNMEVNGKVLRFRICYCDTQIAFPDKEKTETYIRLHLGYPPPYVMSMLPCLEELSDEELAIEYGLMRDESGFFGYTQPYYWTRDGIVNSITGVIESNEENTKFNTQYSEGVVMSVPSYVLV